MFFRGSGFTVNQCAVSYVQEINRKIHPSHLLLPTFLIRRSSDILMSLQPCISAFACTTQYTQFPCHSFRYYTIVCEPMATTTKTNSDIKTGFIQEIEFFFFASGVFIGGPVSPLLRFYCIFHYSIHVQSLNGQPSKC